MNLGSIAHLQYYFARTGLLDGKGAQMTKSQKSSSTVSSRAPSGSGPDQRDSLLSSSPDAFSSYSPSGLPLEATDGFLESPVEELGELNFDGSLMPAPTVSTYKQTSIYVAPPPDMPTLRRELRDSLAATQKVLQDIEESHDSNPVVPPSPATDGADENQGWHEIQGLNLLDVSTLAIRAAKNYYTAHDRPQRLYAIKSERQIRGDLYSVLDVLKRMAGRNFSGGIRAAERIAIEAWIQSISALLRTEESQDKAEHEEWEARTWTRGDWTGKQRARECAFLKSFMNETEEAEELPVWTDPAHPSQRGMLPTPFLQRFRDGKLLVRLHNEVVRRSKRQFGEIKTFHTDTAKPYRCAENLRFWVKAAELRWDVKVQVDVMGVVSGSGDAAWKGFDEALLKWCKAVREEVTAEWREGLGRGKEGGEKMSTQY